MKNTANTVIRLLDSVSNALDLVPVPCLGLTWKGFKALWDAVQKVHDSRAQLEVLTGSVAEFILALDRKLQDQPSLASSISEELRSLRNLIDEIWGFAQEQAGKAFLQRFLQGDEVATSVSTYHWRLLHLYNSFNLSCEIDNKLWQSEFDDARRRDTEAFGLLLGELKDSQEKLFRELFGKLDVQQSSLLAAITAMQRSMVKMNTDSDYSTERQFLQHSITLLQRRSGRVIDIQPWTISSFEVEKKHKIGSGGFSNVYKAMFLGAAMLLNEVKVWERLRHPHILQFLGAGVDEEPPFLVMELMINGNALDFLNVKPIANRVTLVHQASLGLAYLHARGIIHGDLKATNVLIKADESAVIADFGLSMIKVDVTSRSTTVFITGTKRWMSPERMKGRRLAPPVDIYAWAMTAYEARCIDIFTGLVPFGATDESLLYDLVVREEERPERPDHSTAAEVGLTEEIWLLIERSYHQNAQNPSSNPFSFSPFAASPEAPKVTNVSDFDKVFGDLAGAVPTATENKLSFEAAFGDLFDFEKEGTSTFPPAAKASPSGSTTFPPAPTGLTGIVIPPASPPRASGFESAFIPGESTASSVRPVFTADGLPPLPRILESKPFSFDNIFASPSPAVPTNTAPSQPPPNTDVQSLSLLDDASSSNIMGRDSEFGTTSSRTTSPRDSVTSSSKESSDRNKEQGRPSKISMIRLPFMKKKKIQESLPPPQHLSSIVNKSVGRLSPAVDDDDDSEPVKQLCSMGFGRTEAVVALEASSYDFQRALNSLLSG
ncbi:kinase-like domain-containing protein [Lactifluus subvellereus]|nr:kinase-like domain-containing protein [Lactifluus subvellereus]